MTEELNRKADRLSLAYKTKYSEDSTLKDMLSRPQAFVEGAVEGIINLLRQKAYRDGYIAGATENGIIWHDLRKNPDDLPNTHWMNWVIALYDNGTLWCRAKREECVDGIFWINSYHYQIYNVIAWKEIVLPELKESE